MAKPFVLIVGAGPSGVLLAIMLGKQGIPVKLLEMANELDDRPRAAHYAPVAVMELQRAGVFEDIKAAGGFFPDGVCWRKLHGDILTTLYSPKPEDVEHPLICLPLNQLNGILRKHLDQIPAVELLFNHKVTDLGQDENAAWVTVETPEGEKTFTADYIVGCDGANSLVRRKLFGDLNFPGFTWDEQIVATNVRYLARTEQHTQVLADIPYADRESFRFIIHLRNTDSPSIQVLSFIRNTGIWLRVLPPTVCGGFLMGSFLD